MPSLSKLPLEEKLLDRAIRPPVSASKNPYENAHSAASGVHLSFVRERAWNYLPNVRGRTRLSKRNVSGQPCSRELCSRRNDMTGASSTKFLAKPPDLPRLAIRK
jgi:hypothetical protein